MTGIFGAGRVSRLAGRGGRLRARAIWFALKYGVLPWWWYESDCHYEAEGEDGYLPHLRANLRLAWRWGTFTETLADVAFEREINEALPLIRDLGRRR